MKLLIDECLSPRLVQMAQTAGFMESTHIVWLGKSGWKDWELKPLILDGDWTFVTKNSVDFRGPESAPGSKGQYADVAIHAGLICLNGPSEQRKDFIARLSRYRSERAILHQRVATLDEARVGLLSQKDAIAEQLLIVADELARKKELVDKGLTNRFEYTQIMRNNADLVGQRGVIASEIATTNTQKVEALEQLERLATQRVEEAVTKLNEVRTSLTDVEEQMHAARSILERSVIQAPVDGVVVSSVYNSIGSVIAPGEKVMEILPTAKELIVDARLRPEDIDAAEIGQSARLRLSALNMRLTPEVLGEVVHLSADRLVDEATQEPYYRARVRISDDLPTGVTREKLYPGMPVETFINTGERTFLEYLTRPILDSFSRAFVEE